MYVKTSICLFTILPLFLYALNTFIFVYACCLARNIRSAIRWVPSELNNADEGSRLPACVSPSKSLSQIGLPEVGWMQGRDSQILKPR